MKQPPVQLRKPEAITLDGKTVPVEEIAAIHDNRTIDKCFWVILSNDLHQGASYRIDEKHPAYSDVLAYYNYCDYVWVEQTDDAIIFYAHDSQALSGLYEQLEQEKYRFTCQLGAVGQNFINIFRNQGNDVDALDREQNLPDLITDFQSPLEEE